MHPEHFASTRAYVQERAFTALIKILREIPLDDDELTAFLASLDADDARKSVVESLTVRELITEDQAALAYYANPGMRSA